MSRLSFEVRNHRSNGVCRLERRGSTLFWDDCLLHFNTAPKVQVLEEGEFVDYQVAMSELRTYELANATILDHVLARDHLARLRGETFLPVELRGHPLVFGGTDFSRSTKDRTNAAFAHASAYWSGEQWMSGMVWQDKKITKHTLFAILS